MFDTLTRGLLPNLFQMYGVDVTRRDGGYDLEMALPGFRPEQVEVNQQGDTITVEARNDRRSIHRSFTLPEDVDTEQIECSLDNGVLTIRLEQTPQAAPRRISVGSGAQRGSSAITGQTTPQQGAASGTSERDRQGAT